MLATSHCFACSHKCYMIELTVQICERVRFLTHVRLREKGNYIRPFEIIRTCSVMELFYEHFLNCQAICFRMSYVFSVLHFWVHTADIHTHIFSNQNRRAWGRSAHVLFGIYHEIRWHRNKETRHRIRILCSHNIKTYTGNDSKGNLWVIYMLWHGTSASKQNLLAHTPVFVHLVVCEIKCGRNFSTFFLIFFEAKEYTKWTGTILCHWNAVSFLFIAQFCLINFLIKMVFAVTVSLFSLWTKNTNKRKWF